MSTFRSPSRWRTTTRPAYSTHPKQIDYINEISDIARSKSLPVVWTYVAYMENADDCGVWGTRNQHDDALQNIKVGSRKAELDDRCHVDRDNDIVFNKRGASAFFQTHLPSLCVWYRTDTMIVTGGSTSGWRARDRGGQSAERLSHRGSRGMHLGPAREPAFRQPLRYGGKVC